jgi:hypothetical protein
MHTVRSKGNRSAGIGDPYWYEWGIGLLKAVEMLNSDSGIEALAFQKDGIKGWDDVVIRYRSGRQDYYQVKHSRPRTNLTFSSFVTKSDGQLSLLGSLTSSWHEMKTSGTDSSCILITNRSAGKRSGRSKSGIYYPPLADFVRHISTQVERATSLGDIAVPQEWYDAWGVWQTEMGCICNDVKLRFLRALKISTEAPQLEEMRDRLSALLAASFRITNRQAFQLVKNLLSALFDWTTSIRGDKEWISAEDVMAALAESDPEIFGYCDVPTPIPFFPSREKAVEDISLLLTGNGGHRIVFLEADPGSGKTSVVSRIVNQWVEDYSTLIVDIRYYAYRPITPDAPALSADADRSASPDSLWHSLLSQMRERLRGRLLELGVPVRNHFITPYEASEHVLRLAAVLAKEKRSPFVIVIDGIDHAARAHRKGLPSLLRSMPAPETIPEKVRILIAGQPASAYPEYPIWLRNPHRLVVRAGLDPVNVNDIQTLLSHSTTEIRPEDQEYAARIIDEVADGNTLAAVFSVAEAETCQTLDEIASRLSERQLHSGVHAYYRVIWDSAIPDSPVGIAPYLSAVLCILRERINGNIMHQAFPDWEKPAPEWNSILKKLEPLVVCDENGYRVRHNDIRVLLEQELRADQDALQRVASLLADYYMGPSADPFFRQESVFSLLQLAGRDSDKAHVFDPGWVLDAAAYGRDLSAVHQEAEDAFLAIPDIKDWDVALSVACGGMTLTKLSECLDAFPDLADLANMPQVPLPQCLETERFVPPFNRWNENTIRQVLCDARMLEDRGEPNRAQGLMEHWFSEVAPMKVVNGVSGITDNRGGQNEPHLAIGVDSLFEDWGALTFRLGVTANRENPSTHLEHKGTYLFEKGWVTECIAESHEGDVYPSLKAFHPMYLSTLEVAVEETSRKGMWNVVGKFLKVLLKEKDGLHLGFRIKAAFWALKAIGEDAAKIWLEILPEVRAGKSGDVRVEMPLMIYVAKAIGWIEPQRVASAIASELTEVSTSQRRNNRDRRSLHLPLCAAAMIGLLERMLSKGDIEVAAALVLPQTIRSAIELIWKHLHSLDFHEYHDQALHLTFELIELCQDIGNAHSEMVVSLAITKTESFPVDQKMPALWEVLRRAGRRDRLRNWAEHWIGEQGAVWSGIGYSERAEIVLNLSHLARDEGWIELAAAAEERLRHRVIGYSSHKEYAFQEPLDWLEELVYSDPSAWCEEGLQLLDICRECDDQGGDNRLGSAIEKEVGTASFRCGPASAWAFFNSIDPEGERYWLQKVRATLITAAKRAIADRVVTDHSDMLALWSCAVGLTRWFDKYQARTITALRDNILESVPPQDREELVEWLQRLTPGEFTREEYDKDRQQPESADEHGTSEPIGDDAAGVVSELVRKVDEGYEPSLMKIGRVAMHVARDNPPNRGELMGDLFALVDANRKYVTGWDHWGQSHPLRDLVATIRENEVWELMRTAVRSIGHTNWSRSVPHNVHLICLYRAVSEGIDCLKKGTQCVLEMHRLWVGLAKFENSSQRECTTDNEVDTWPEFVALVLRCLLSSDSAETVSAALRGLCTVVDVTPRVLPTLFDHSNGEQLSRLLLGAEVWVTRHPKATAEILEKLWCRRWDLDTGDRIQLWICILTHNSIKGQVEARGTFLPKPLEEANDLSTYSILTKPRRILEIPPNLQGSIRLANLFSTAKEWISRFGKITRRNTEDLESTIAEGLDARDTDFEGDEKKDTRSHFATEDGDMIITQSADSILNDALERELRKPGWNESHAGDIATAVTNGDDPWILKRSPLPSRSSFDWPEQKEVDEWLASGTDSANVLNRLRLLSSGSDVPSAYRVLGSYLRLFTSHYDCEMWYWLETVGSVDIKARSAPLCPSGRCFQFLLPGRFEPRASDRGPLVLFSRSFLCLSFSSLEVVPAKIFQDRLGWQPTVGNPLEWEKEGRVIARYETYHGPLDYNWSRRNMRQPTLSRWVVNADELQGLGNLNPQWDHQIYPFSED